MIEVELEGTDYFPKISISETFRSAILNSWSVLVYIVSICLIDQQEVQEAIVADLRAINADILIHQKQLHLFVFSLIDQFNKLILEGNVVLTHSSNFRG